MFNTRVGIQKLLSRPWRVACSKLPEVVVAFEFNPKFNQASLITHHQYSTAVQGYFKIINL